MVATIHYAGQTFTMAPSVDIDWLTDEVRSAFNNQGGVIEADTTDGMVVIVVTPGVPVAVSTSKDAETYVPFRVR